MLCLQIMESLILSKTSSRLYNENRYENTKKTQLRLIALKCGITPYRLTPTLLLTRSR